MSNQSLIETKQIVLKNKESLHRTDTGNAERLVRDYGHIIRYCHKHKEWLIYNTKKWEIDESGEINRMATITIREIMYSEVKKIKDKDEQKALIKWSMSSESENKLKSMIKLASHELGITVKPSELDQNPWALNVQNGTLNLKTGSLEPHRKEDFISKITPISYNPQAKCDLWLKFLNEIFEGKTELIDFVQRAIGYSLTGITFEQCLFMLLGKGSNGKSKLINVMHKLLGEYGSQAGFTTFTVSTGERIRNDLARIAQSRFVVASEPEKDHKLSEAQLKQMTGENKITARFLYKESFEYTPQFKVWLEMNHRPIVRDQSFAIWRRILIIPFNVKIDKDKDKELEDKFAEELPGILAWAVQGCIEWQKKGLSAPEEVKSATQDYRIDMDNVARFIDACCVVETKARVPVGKLFENYLEWFKGDGEGEPLGKHKFNNEIAASEGVYKSKKRYHGSESQWVWCGLGLLGDMYTMSTNSGNKSTHSTN